MKGSGLLLHVGSVSKTSGTISLRCNWKSHCSSRSSRRLGEYLILSSRPCSVPEVITNNPFWNYHYVTFHASSSHCLNIRLFPVFILGCFCLHIRLFLEFWIVPEFWLDSSNMFLFCHLKQINPEQTLIWFSSGVSLFEMSWKWLILTFFLEVRG